MQQRIGAHRAGAVEQPTLLALMIPAPAPMNPATRNYRK
jgi:hypothetical protein